LLFSREQYLAVADAYLRGVEWRIAAGLNRRLAIVIDGGKLVDPLGHAGACSRRGRAVRTGGDQIGRAHV
jgi:hypothetical protein